MSNDFGIYLKKVRLNRKLSLKQVERKSGISNAYLSLLERGKRGVPTLLTLARINKAL